MPLPPNGASPFDYWPADTKLPGSTVARWAWQNYGNWTGGQARDIYYYYADVQNAS